VGTAQGVEAEHVDSVASWHTLAAPASTPAIPADTQRSFEGQSAETAHAAWHREKTHTSGDWQSLLRVHPDALATGVELLQPATATSDSNPTASDETAPHPVPHLKCMNSRASKLGTVPQESSSVN